MTPEPVARDPGARPGTLAWLLLAPLLAWLALFVVVPALLLLGCSLGERDEFGQVLWGFSLENYARLLDPVYLRIFLRSLGFAALTTGLCLLIGYPVAYHLARAAPRVRELLLLLVMVPFWTSFLVRTYAWMAILREEGLLNALVAWLQPAWAPLGLLYTPAAVVTGLVYSYLPFLILPVYASVEKLDGALIEAAHDLGAGPWRVFPTVILPLTLPGIAAGVTLVFVPAVAMFAVTDLLGGARVPLIGNVIQNQFLQARDWPFGAALGVALLGLFLVSQLVLRALRPRGALRG
ncbi:MAG: ABC transporter permease [Opitutia bacterium Tous-C8FEB]|nr:MAG: ABC transporter permease [Opitutae bacterium Tous-C8FEB]